MAVLLSQNKAVQAEIVLTELEFGKQLAGINLIRSLGGGYTGSDSRIGRWQGGALNLSQALPAPKQLNLISWAMQAGLKFSGCPTQSEPIFESRAVSRE